jgi:hypothetical protein
MSGAESHSNVATSVFTRCFMQHGSQKFVEIPLRISVTEFVLLAINDVLHHLTNKFIDAETFVVKEAPELVWSTGENGAGRIN